MWILDGQAAQSAAQSGGALGDLWHGILVAISVWIGNWLHQAITKRD